MEKYEFNSINSMAHIIPYISQMVVKLEPQNVWHELTPRKYIVKVLFETYFISKHPTKKKLAVKISIV
jgi:hypothetical protein